jgi:hypothetical protein
MSFFQKTQKPSYVFMIRYDNEQQLYHYKVNIFDDPLKCQVFNESSQSIDKLLSRCLYEGNSKDNPISAFWHYNNADLPSILFSS